MRIKIFDNTMTIESFPMSSFKQKQEGRYRIKFNLSKEDNLV